MTDAPSGQAPFDLTDFAYAPGGGMFSTGKQGNVAWVSPTGEAKSIAKIPVMVDNDMGLISIALDHDHLSNRHIYTLSHHPYTKPGTGALEAMARLSRWTVTVDAEGTPTGLTGERRLFEYPQVSYIHGLWGLQVAPDGTLWLTTGDGAWHMYTDPMALLALNLNEPLGKVLHINPDGSGVASNPYYNAANPNSWESRTYAHGLRSPFRFSLDPRSGLPIVGDVGWNTYEEITVVRRGGFLGWPCWEGNIRTPGFAEMPACAGVGNPNPPVFTYPRTWGSAVTGGVIYTGTAYPAQYRNSYFFGDFTSGKVWNMMFGADGRLQRAPDAAGFAANIGGPVKFDRAPNGDIVFADIFSGKVRRLSYAAGNRAPTAKATSTNDPASGKVTFDGSDSFDPDGELLTYRWNFGDGTTGAGAKVSHTYDESVPAPVTVTLTVTDPLGAKATAQLTVVPANNAPKLNTAFPEAGRTYKVGDEVQLSATATDNEDGALEVEWSTELLHCRSTGCHSHPGPSGTGATFATVFSDHGEDTRLHVTAKATDSRGAVTQRTFIAQPRLRTLQLKSNLPATMQVGDLTTNTTTVTAGATVSVTAAEKAADQFGVFTGWADGGERQRLFVMPDADATLTATYQSAIDRRYATDAAFRTTLGAVIGPEVTVGTARMRTYQGGRAYSTPTGTVCEVHGAILGKFDAMGGHTRFGYPITDESTTADPAVRYSDFTGTPGTAAVSIYWTKATGANEVYGSIRGKWLERGGEAGPLGYPIIGERSTPDNKGRFNHFSKGGSVYWTPATGAHNVQGVIRTKWEKLGWERGVAGFPTSDELATADTVGRYNTFSKGLAIYWTPTTGAHEVYGAIGGRYAKLGNEKSYLGYPTSGEYSVPGGRRNDFQNGYIIWEARTGRVTDYRK